jgi:hypothetical protein
MVCRAFNLLHVEPRLDFLGVGSYIPSRKPDRLQEFVGLVIPGQ